MLQKYSISQVKKIALIVAIVGAVFFIVGVFMHNGSHASDDHAETHAVVEQTETHAQDATHASEVTHAVENEHAEDPHHQMVQAQHHNKPWSAFFISAFLFFGLSAATLFFLAIQHAANAGWSIVVTRIMEGIASFIPYGVGFMVLLSLAAILDWNHMYHWMEHGLTDPESSHYDVLIHGKQPFLNKYFWFARICLYGALLIFFLRWIKNTSKLLDEKGDWSIHSKLHTRSVMFIVFFALASAAWAWDFLMSIDPHWYSTLYIWYTMVSCLVTGVAFMIIFSNYMKAQGKLPLFTPEIQHDLTKYLFGFSLLWSYLFYDQFMLIWYANIPEETVYFQGRFELYPTSYFWMLIPNLLMPLIILVSSSIKRNSKVVLPMCVVVILGHFWDYFNIVMPGTVGPNWSFGFMEWGAFFFMLGIFVWVVLRTLDKLNLEPKGNPYFHESEIYEYPF